MAVDPDEIERHLRRHFHPGRAGRPLTYYVKLGERPDLRWTLRVSDTECRVERGNTAGRADCVVVTTLDLFWRIVEDGYVPGPVDVVSGRFRTNDPLLLAKLRTIFGR